MKKFSDLENICYKLLYSDLNIDDFEMFIYDESNRENISNDDYLELISINYHSKSSKYEVKKILEKYIDFGIFESYRVESYLERALINDDNLGYYLIEIYELYCHGYYFLRELALGFGVICTYTPKGYSDEQWYNLHLEEKQRLHRSFQPKLNECLARAIGWLSNGNVKITGKKDDLDRWEYIDLRSPEDKEFDDLKSL